MTPEEAGLAFVTPAAYADEAAFHEACAVLLSYPSANRDEEVFTDPFLFDVGRNPNKHLAFGFGAHYCLGAMLARMELKALFTELLARVDSIELAGTPTYMQTLFVGGPKTVPVRYSLTEARSPA